MQQHNSSDTYIGIAGGVGGGGSILPWTLPQVHDPFLLAPPAPPTYGSLFSRRPFGYDGGSPAEQMRVISESLGQVVHPPLGDLQKMTAQEIMDAKAIAASKSHSEAERRRRERINNHLAKLRSLLPSTTKTDKASLLAEVIQHVKELKRQTCVIAETSPVPTEIDDLTVDNASDEDGKWVIKASICCQDRPDLLPDLIRTLKEMRLRTVRAEITTLGGRVRNVLFITGDEDEDEEEEEEREQQYYCISSIQEALKAVMEKANGNESGHVKRQRTNTSIVDYRSF